MQTEQVIGIGPDLTTGKTGTSRQFDKFTHRILVGAFRVNGFAFVEFKALRTDLDNLGLTAHQVQFHRPQFVVIESLVFE